MCGPDFEEQCPVASRLGLGFVELCSAWETNVLDLDDERLGTVRRLLADHGSSIGSPVGKMLAGLSRRPFRTRGLAACSSAKPSAGAAPRA